MSNEIKILDDILYHNLRPWLEQNRLDEKFALKVNEVKEELPAFNFRYELGFLRPVNHKTKYYQKLILSETVKTINQITRLISEDDNSKLVKYWLNDTLNKKLKTRLKDIGKLVKEKDYSLDYINPKKTSFEIDQDHKSNTYIVQLLKLAYMRIYMEIQGVYEDRIDDILIVDDFYTQLLFEPVPDIHYLKEITVIEIEANPIKPTKKQPKPQEVALTSFTYKQLATNPDNLTNLHDSLKLNHFIAQDTSLTNFKKAFSGKEITNPIEWTGNISELYYFIKLIHKEHKYVDDLKQKQWEVTCLCFVQEGGKPFDRNKFRGQKRPNTTGDKLDNIVELLK